MQSFSGITDNLIQIILAKMDGALVGNEGLIYLLKFFELYFSFGKENQNSFCSEVKLRFLDLQELGEKEILLELTSIKYSIKIKALMKLQEFLKINRLSNYSKQKFLVPFLSLLLELGFKELVSADSKKTSNFLNFTNLLSTIFQVVTEGLSI